MDIEELMNNLNKTMHEQKGEHFTVEYQKTQFGIVQGASIALIFGVLTVLCLQWTLEFHEWYFAALAGYFAYVFKSSGLGLCLAATATYIGFKKTKTKQEIIGR